MPLIMRSLRVVADKGGAIGGWKTDLLRGDQALSNGRKGGGC